jgi:hypothetical protein
LQNWQLARKTRHFTGKGGDYTLNSILLLLLLLDLYAAVSRCEETFLDQREFLWPEIATLNYFRYGEATPFPQ